MFSIQLNCLEEGSTAASSCVTSNGPYKDALLPMILDPNFLMPTLINPQAPPALLQSCNNRYTQRIMHKAL